MTASRLDISGADRILDRSDSDSDIKWPVTPKDRWLELSVERGTHAPSFAHARRLLAAPGTVSDFIQVTTSACAETL